MIRLAVVAVGLAVAMGCGPCGQYTLSDMTTAVEYEGTWREQCGALYGTSGVWDMMGDGLAEIWFDLDAPGDRSWDGLDLNMAVTFPVSLLVPGTTIGPPDLLGVAYVNRCVSCPNEDTAGLAEGTIEVLGGWTGEDPCEPEDGPTFRLGWELSFGVEGGPRYAARGADEVQFSTFVSDACSDID